MVDSRLDFDLYILQQLDNPVPRFRSLIKLAIKAWYEQIYLLHSENSNLREQILVVTETTSSCPKTCASCHNAFHMLEKISARTIRLLRLAPILLSVIKETTSM